MIGRQSAGRARSGVPRRSWTLAFGATCVTVALSGWSGGSAGNAAGGAAAAGRRLRVVVAFYPAAFLARRVGGIRVSTTTLAPPGVEPHDLELTPGQVDDLESADVAVIGGGGFQPVVEDAAGQRDGPTVDLWRSVPAKQRRAGDPHVWLDPVLVLRMVDGIEHAFARVDPRGRGSYARNARALRSDLHLLDARFRAGLAHCARRDVVTSHDAFGYLAREYGLRQRSVSGLAADTEPGPERLAQLADFVRKHHVTTIFTETLVSPRVAKTLASEAGGVHTATLDPLEGLSRARIARGASYLTVMRENLTALRTALGCR